MYRRIRIGSTVSWLSTLLVIVGFRNVACVTAEESATIPVQEMIAKSLAENDQTSSFRFDPSVFRDDTRPLPIGVFDSGIGGLTVLEAILSLDAFNNDSLSPGPDGRRDFENEKFVYLGDQANMPYGNYAAVGKEAFLRELIVKDAVFLLGQRYWPNATSPKPVFDKPPVKAIVIACNTATAYGLEDLRTAIKVWNIPIPVIGVVEAGARGVAEGIASTDIKRGVAVLATVGTCSSLAYPKAIVASVGLAGKRVPEIVQQGSVGLAGAIEGDSAFIASVTNQAAVDRYQGPRCNNAAAPIDSTNAARYGFESNGITGDPDRPESWKLNSIPNYVRYDVVSMVEKYRSSGGTTPIDTVVLGCTHFPLVQKEIQDAFRELREYREEGKQPYTLLIAERISLVNPAELTAKELFRELARAKLRLGNQENRTKQKDQFFISVPDPNWPQIRLTPEGALDRDYKYGRATNKLDVEDTRVVPMATRLLPESSLNLIRTRLPEVWNRLQ